MRNLPTPPLSDWSEQTIFTVWHSNQPLDSFTHLLHAYGIKQLIDVRSTPRSNYNPQFNDDILKKILPDAKMDYIHLVALGGLRRAQQNSVNTGLSAEGFRGYADYMATPMFLEAIVELIQLSHFNRTAIMCAEAAFSNCHRSMIADALCVRGIPVIEILSEGSYRRHKLSNLASVVGTSITYPPRQTQLL